MTSEKTVQEKSPDEKLPTRQISLPMPLIPPKPPMLTSRETLGIEPDFRLRISKVKTFRGGMSRNRN